MPSRRPKPPFAPNGDFLKGEFYPSVANTPTPEEHKDKIPPHPTKPGRNARGQVMNRGAQTAEFRSVFNDAFLGSVTPDEMAALARRLYGLCMDPDLPVSETRSLMELFCNRFMGLPIKDVKVTSDKKTTNLTVDLTRLTTDELKLYLNLQTKVAPSEEIIDVVPRLTTGENA